MPAPEALPERRWALIVFIAALAPRLAVLAWWQSHALTEAYGYDPYPTIAEVWLGWRSGHLDVTHPPVYSFWNYLVFLLMRRPSFPVLQALNVLFSCASCVLIGRWTARAIGPVTGRLAALWAAFDPLLVYFSVQLQSEPFFVLLELVFFRALQRLGSPPAAPLAALGLGLLGGLVSETRSVFAAYAPVLALSWLAAGWRQARTWAMTALVTAGWIIPVAAWGLRNQAHHGLFVPFAIQSGWSLWEGFTLDREEVRRRPEAMIAELRGLGMEGQETARQLQARGDYFTRKTRDFMRDHPGEAARIVAGKFLRFWRPWPYDPYGPAVRRILGAYFVILFALAALGAWRQRSNPALVPVWALIAALSILHSFFFTSLRYRSPLEPFLIALAAAGLLELRLTASRPSSILR